MKKILNKIMSIYEKFKYFIQALLIYFLLIGKVIGLNYRESYLLLSLNMLGNF